MTLLRIWTTDEDLHFARPAVSWNARYYAEAEATGRLIGENGDSIVFPAAGAEGLMGACARGVSAAGGDVVGHSAAIFR